MAKPIAELYDIDARSDPHLAEYERARDLLQTSDWRDGLKELEGLAHRGSIMSMLLVSDAMRNGWLYHQDLPRAEAWYQVAVESGSARGLFGLGLTRLLMGRYSQAIQDLEAAIARRFPPAYNALAGIYFRGDGVPADRQKALDLYRRGAALGHLPAKRNLVQQSIHGRFGPFRRVVGILTAFPMAYELVRVKARTPYTDRLR
jgi:TPR repeat protein